VTEALNTVQSSSQRSNLSLVSIGKISFNAFRGIKLEASPSIGDVGQDWRFEHNFVRSQGENSATPFHFRWKNQGESPGNLTYRVMTPVGSVLDTKPIKVVASGKGSFFTIDLGALPERSSYVIQLSSTDRNGNPKPPFSNNVTLTSVSPRNVPFNLAQLDVDEARDKWSVPGVTVGVLCPNNKVYQFVSGTRRHGQIAGVQLTDLWHIGSDTKAMTAALIGKLVDRGKLRWDDSIWDLTYGPKNLFPELKGGSTPLHPYFKNVTIEHLASHRSGMMMPNIVDQQTRKLENYSLDPRRFRWSVVSYLLIRDHDGTVGEWRYGFGNYMLLGVIIERLSGQPYEMAMKNEIFDPIGMTTARFGMPSDQAISISTNPWLSDPSKALTVSTVHHTNGHFFEDPKTVVSNLALPPVWNPAGGVYLSISDWLKFLRLYLYGSSGSFSLSSHIIAKLTSPYMLADRTNGPTYAPAEDQDDPNYGFGWGIINSGSPDVFLNHDGTYHRYYAGAQVHSSSRIAVVAVTNITGGDKTETNSTYGPGNEVVATLIDRFTGLAKADCK
jgi:CubicO group peptidase (beta-lactamase class C family)